MQMFLVLVLILSSILLIPDGGDCTNQTITEYQLPMAAEAHEILYYPLTSELLITLRMPSTLVKVQLNKNEQIVGLTSHKLLGSNSYLHGLALSTVYPNFVWITFEDANKIALIHPGLLGKSPVIRKKFTVPGGAIGPHSINEYDGNIWITCRETKQVVRINALLKKKYKVYDSYGTPVFIVQHPVNKDIYASSEDGEAVQGVSRSAYMRINPTTGKTQFLYTNVKNGGINPAGIIVGPNKQLWFVMAGPYNAAQGIFGRIDDDGKTLRFFHLQNQDGVSLSQASMLYLAFNQKYPFTLFLLASTLVNNNENAPDMVLIVKMKQDFNKIDSVQILKLPTQPCAAHRIVLLKDTAFVTELETLKLARISNYY